jgi:hypothetical protein
MEASNCVWLKHNGFKIKSACATVFGKTKTSTSAVASIVDDALYIEFTNSIPASTNILLQLEYSCTRVYVESSTFLMTPSGLKVGL